MLNAYIQTSSSKQSQFSQTKLSLLVFKQDGIEDGLNRRNKGKNRRQLALFCCIQLDCEKARTKASFMGE